MSNGGVDERLKRIYSILSQDDDEDRACEDIPESACRELPRNYVLNVFNGAATKLSEIIAGPRILLPWLLTAIGAPVFLIGMLMPIRYAGALIPALAVSGQLRRFSVRKWFWVWAGAVEATCLVLMIAAAWWLSPTWAGFSIVALLALFSIARGTGSVAFQDVVGKTIGRGRRGEMLSRRTLLGGALSVCFGIALALWIGGSNDLGMYLGLLLVGAGLWALAALFFAAMAEQPGATEGGRNPLSEGRAGVRLWQAAWGYRRYITARALLLSVELGAPFYVLQAHHSISGHMDMLALLLIASALAQVLSSPFWGRFSDISSRRVMIIAGLIGAGAAALALAFPDFPPMWRNSYVFAVIFGILGFAESGVRLGRKTFLIDAVAEKERPTYIAFANTLMGLLTLLSMVLGILPQVYGPSAALAALALLSLAGAAAAQRMPEARNFSETVSADATA